jgi:uncharacterized protein
MIWLRRGIIAVLAIIVVGYAAIIATLYFKQRDFQYAPAGEVTSLSDTLLTRTEAVSIPTGDDTVLAGWYAPPEPGMPTILYYKGNTGSFTAEHERYERFVEAGYGFLAFDYRGFPLTPGTLSQDRILEDALNAFDWLNQQQSRIVIWGRSLGTGPATYVASERDADALLLETPFLSAVGVAAERYWFIPVGWFMFDQFPSNAWIRDVTEPVFVAHGTADETISVSNGERLYALAPNQYDLWIEPGAGHGDLWARGIWTRADAFFRASEAQLTAGR